MTILDIPADGTTGSPAARVVAQHRDRYVVRADGADHDAVLAGRHRHRIRSAEELPAVGDWVTVSAPSGADGVLQIHAVLPRRSVFRRKAAGDTTDVQVLAANVDVAIIATALPSDVNPRRLERYLTLAWESGATPLVVLTKADLVGDIEPMLAAVRRVAVGVDVLAVSTLTGAGIAALRRRLEGDVTAVLLGSSGVGKSTLVNTLLGDDRQRTAALRAAGAGRHTTTHRELLELPGGGALIDTPGMRELQLWLAGDGLDAAFDDITTLAAGCRFGDCAHHTEPGCAVRAAIESGGLDAARFRSWVELGRELAFLERRHDAAASAAARKQVKVMSRALRSRLREKGP